jgi:hypothetical protein
MATFGPTLARRRNVRVPQETLSKRTCLEKREDSVNPQGYSIRVSRPTLSHPVRGRTAIVPWMSRVLGRENSASACDPGSRASMV